MIDLLQSNSVPIARYTYNLNGQLRVKSSGNATTTISHNAAGLITNYTTTGIPLPTRFTYTHFLDGNIESITDTRTGFGTTRFTYDTMGRLTSERDTLSGSTTTFEFDNFGNRESREVINTATGAIISNTSYDFDLNNRLLQTSTTTGGITDITRFFYDPNGNNTLRLHDTLSSATGTQPQISGTTGSRSAEIFEFDAFNRLTTFQTYDMLAVYTYHANGMRASKTVNGVETRHLWDGMFIVGDIITEGQTHAQNALPFGASSHLDAGNNISEIVTFHRGLGGQLISTRQSNGQVFRYLHNGLGDVMGLVNSTGQMIADYGFDAFGNQLPHSFNLETLHNPFRYRGEYHDLSGTGFIYLRHRFYDPNIGRFITADPYWNVGNMQFWGGTTPSINAIRSSINLYAFVMNNPIMFIDPLGLYPNTSRFANSTEAAIDWGHRFFSVTNFIGREKASIIFRVEDEDGNYFYSYTYAIIGGETSINILAAHRFVPTPLRGDTHTITIVAAVHSHPNSPLAYDARVPSLTDETFARTGGGLLSGPITTYIVTPSYGAPVGGFQSDGMFDVVRLVYEGDGDFSAPRSANHVYTQLGFFRQNAIINNMFAMRLSIYGWGRG